MPFEIVRNDITRMDVDAIVNAANNSLLGGGGVDGAIHRAAGPRLLEECRTLNGCETGQAKLTRAYDLPCKYVIHTVGPIWQGGERGERALLADCYRNALALAKEYRCESVAFPLISAGAYGYPAAQALKVAVDEIAAFLRDNDMLIYLVVLTRDAIQPCCALYQSVAAFIDEAYVDDRRAAPEATPGPEASMGPGDLFRRAHREDDARNETVFAPRAAATAAPRERAAQIPATEGERFSGTLLRMIAEKGVSEADCCRRANVDRRQFNKIRNNPDIRPCKQTVLAFAVALELSPDEARALLASAGYALSRYDKSDVVVEYCIAKGITSVIDINQVLFKLDLQPLG